jgi:hypothetical protein
MTIAGSSMAGDEGKRMPRWEQNGGFDVLAQPIAGFDRSLFAARAIYRCPGRSKARSWPRSHWHLANVG